MVDIKEDKLEEEIVPSEPTEAEEDKEQEVENIASEGGEVEPEETSKSITEELQEIQKKKEEEKEPAAKPKSTIDLSKLNAFKEKVIKEFGLREVPDRKDCIKLYYNDFILLKLLPRKNCWYGVYREIPEEENRWRALRVHNQEEEDTTYEHIKEFIKTNTEE